MSTANLPSGSGERRIRVSRLAAAVVTIAAALALGYFLLGEGSVTSPPGSETSKPKDVAALFELIQGSVKTRAVGGLDWRSAEVKVPLRKSDLVRTYPSSSAEIKFFDETRVTVRPDSLITIEETSRDPTSSAGNVAWKVSSGEINYETARKESGSTEAVTPTFRLALESNSAGSMRVGEGGSDRGGSTFRGRQPRDKDRTEDPSQRQRRDSGGSLRKGGGQTGSPQRAFRNPPG